MTQFRITGLSQTNYDPSEALVAVENYSRRQENYSSQGGKYVRELPTRGRRDPYHTNYDAPRPLVAESIDCKFFNTERGCQTLNCKFQHRVIKGFSFCQFYTTIEGCRRGNTCGFIHSPDAVPSLTLRQTDALVRLPQPVNFRTREPFSSASEFELDPRERDGPLEQIARFPQLCHFFNKPEGCKLGNSCGFVHKDIMPHVTLCHFYRSEKGCLAKDCGFVHQ